MPKNTPKTSKRKKSAKEKAAYIIAAGAIIAAILGMVRFQVTCDKKPAKAPEPLMPDTVIVTDNQNPDPPKLHSFRGYVFDCFGYAVSGVEVKVVHTGGAIIQNFKTDNIGEYVVKELSEKGTHKFRIDYSGSSVERNLDFNRIEKGTYRDTLIVNPISRIEITLCKDVESREPIKSYIQENPNIKIDDLNVSDTLRNLKGIYCHLRIFGENNYHIGKDIKILYKWYFNGELQELVAPQDVGISEYGWRTSRAHPVWRGEWVIKLTTVDGFELGRQNFNVIK